MDPLKRYDEIEALLNQAGAVVSAIESEERITELSPQTLVNVLWSVRENIERASEQLKALHRSSVNLKRSKDA